AETAENANAKVFFKSYSYGDATDPGYLVSLTNTEASNAEANTTNVTKGISTTVAANAGGENADWVLYNCAEIYVMSEQAWVTAAQQNLIEDRGDAKGEY